MGTLPSRLRSPDRIGPLYGHVIVLQSWINGGRYAYCILSKAATAASRMYLLSRALSRSLFDVRIRYRWTALKEVQSDRTYLCLSWPSTATSERGTFLAAFTRSSTVKRASKQSDSRTLMVLGHMPGKLNQLGFRNTQANYASADPSRLIFPGHCLASASFRSHQRKREQPHWQS